MRGRPFVILVVLALVFSAAVGGVAYAYATSVMPGLDRVDPVSSIVAMRGIIAEAASNVLFLFLLIGLTVLAVMVGFVAVRRRRQPGSRYLLAGSLCALIGGIVTVAFNVPLNRELADVDPAVITADDAGAKWQAYVGLWVVWNYVRCALSLVAAAFFAVGLIALGRGSETAARG